MNSNAALQLAKRLTGEIPSPRSSALKGVVTGATLFFFFEFMSSINDNIPRVPVSWLMIAASVMMESVLFFRIVRLLSRPRKPDFYFILRLGYDARTTVARTALRSGHGSFIPFLAAILAVSAAGELFLLHERSVILLAAVPAACLLVLQGTELLMTALITRHAIPCTRKDDIGEEGALSKGSALRRQLAASSVTIARMTAGLFPASLRIIIMRNMLHLLRGEVIITGLIVLAVPVITALLIIMLHDPHSPFATMLPLIFIFMSNFHYASELSEASETLQLCHWYRFSPRQLLAGTFFTFAVPALLPVVTFFALTIPALTMISGIVRALNFLAAAAVTVLIAARLQNSTKHSDSDPAIAFALFGLIVVGNFIPYAGILFTLAALGVVLIIDRSMVFGNQAA